MKNRSRRLRKKLKVAEFKAPVITALEGSAETELHAAAWAGDVEWVKSLIGDGADVNHINNAGETPLHGAAAWGRTEVVKYFISIGANINIQAVNTGDFSPLHWAAGWGGLETTIALVEAGASISIKDAFGRTPEQIAMEKHKHDVVKYLRSYF